MVWQALCRFYDNNVDKLSDLMPIGHTYKNADIEIEIDKDGKFLSAKKVEKEDKTIIIPVTEASASRTGSIAAHPLNEEVSYAAGDFKDFCRDFKEQGKADKKYAAYCSMVSAWNESEFAHSMVRAVRAYTAKKTLVKDLIGAGLVNIAEDGGFEGDSEKYGKLFVRFYVEGCDEPRTWMNEELRLLWSKFLPSIQTGKKDFCYVTGKYEVRCDHHPKNIIPWYGNAKLISSQDTDNGFSCNRFETKEKASCVSYTASQKLTNAASYLTRHRGVSLGARAYACFTADNQDVPNLVDPVSTGDELFFDETFEDELYRKALWQTLHGLSAELKDTDDVILIAMDAATTGRMNFVDYSETFGADYLSKVEKWNETLCWPFLSFTEEKKPIFPIRTPNFSEIINCAFGDMSGGFLKTSTKLMMNQSTRLAACLINGARFPRDIVLRLVRRASRQALYPTNNKVRDDLLSVTCAVLRKTYLDAGLNDGRSFMVLDTDNNDRSYLFGRLLAVYERAEVVTYDKSITRDPAALRMMERFSRRPQETLALIDNMTKCYFNKLSPGSRFYFRQMIGEITKQFKEEDAPYMNRALDDTYLIGYYHQKAAFRKKKEEKKDE